MAGAVWVSILAIIGQMFAPLVGAITPVIKDELNKFMTELYKKALATPNPWDDFFVGLLLDIMVIPRPPPV